jgi:hypothetical protein
MESVVAAALSVALAVFAGFWASVAVRSYLFFMG